MTLHTPELQKYSLITRYSIVLYSGNKSVSFVFNIKTIKQPIHLLIFLIFLSQMCQKFCNILVMQNLAALDAFVKVVMRCWTCLILSKISLPDTHRLAYMTWSMGLKSRVLDLPHIAWLLKFLQPEGNFLNHLIIVLWSTVPSPF